MYVKTACCFTPSLRKMLYCVSDINLKFTVMRIASALVNGSALHFHLPRFLYVRHHSSIKLFVTGLSYDTNEPVLRDAFGQHGEIIEVKVICDHVTGKSRGYGFVRFLSETIAAATHKEMNGQILDGRCIRVSYAHKDLGNLSLSAALKLSHCSSDDALDAPVKTLTNGFGSKPAFEPRVLKRTRGSLDRVKKPPTADKAFQDCLKDPFLVGAPKMIRDICTKNAVVSHLLEYIDYSDKN
ncbi:small RNA-binding protein 11, chloroplastic isoform X3 [Glycine max]|uniref:small RNA-binding protein 11, chloroplastic isoform X3 n=1 Tax=Glycine max TaxID=3847 RepID=UPI0003DEA4C2|nr:small RNA-binding protein 11, chloroplastic isoform X3 [Glycine max]|eukprot:XP_014634083.2 small RNA-binding protein 11, chloroplastic [Glycine max]